MKAETEEYKKIILKQIDADFQTLHTLANFITLSTTRDTDSFSQSLLESNKENKFITMAYFDTNGVGIQVMLDERTDLDITVDSLPDELKNSIEKSLNGESVISSLFTSDISEDKIFVYSVPVHENGNIIGTLVASDSLGNFYNILDSDTVLYSHGHIHLIGTDGTFLIRSKYQVVGQNYETIFEGPYIDREYQNKIKAAMNSQESIFSSFQYQGKDHMSYLEPIGINGWYLYCVNRAQEVNNPIYQSIKVAQLTFLGVLILILFLLLYGYRLIHQNNKELLLLAYRDPLTGADNLTRFTQKLTASLEQSIPCSVVALNIHQFKFINEIFGKEQADQLLCDMKEVLDNHLTPGEFFCRSSADLFYISLKETCQEEISTRLTIIMNEVCHNSINNHNNYQVLLYCGVVVVKSPKHEKNICDKIMTRALFALARSKGVYQHNVSFYDTEIHKKEELENYMESHMVQALENNEFKLFLQPRINLKNNSIDGAEALVRWVTSDGNLISPAQFIPLFEKNGFCIRLDMYMVECVCKQLREWIDNGVTPIPISVNQSKRLFYETDYVQNLSNLVAKYKIPCNLITLEILEGLAMENVDQLNTKIVRLKKEGFRISMDDFGSGYSSLNILGHLKIDELKLDRSFLLDISSKRGLRQKTIMEEIVQLAKRLHITTVAEGVETLEHEQLIKSFGCDYGQGYYYSRPISASDFNETYMKGSNLPTWK